MDFHTHNLQAPAGEAIINLPAAWTTQPALFQPREGALYSAGIHPWWTAEAEQVEQLKQALPQLWQHPQVVAIGECGLDALRGAKIEEQEALFEWQIGWAERLQLPVTLHVVRAFDRLLRLKKELRPTTQWTIHGFRGRPALAKQLLTAGFDLSFGLHYNSASWEATPSTRRHRESDNEQIAYNT